MIDFPISISDYNYPLTGSHIAKFPLNERDETRLLVYNEGQLSDSRFNNLTAFIPEKSLLIFNNTRVIKARLIFEKQEGTLIEIFCLTSEQSGEGYAVWKCYIGNARKWKDKPLTLQSPNGLGKLTATKELMVDDTYHVRFDWEDNERSFEDILETYGKVPLPPYLNREPVDEDTRRYQTLYAKFDGSVAAPTAGLHFTPTVFNALEEAKCTLDYLTLHVGAGTFKPVTAPDVRNHSMHEERIIINRDTVLRILQNIGNVIIPVGTTSMRSLESIYWLGHQMITGKDSITPTGQFTINQWEPYQTAGHISTSDALQAVYSFMKQNDLLQLSGYTRIMIVPGYKFRVCEALITNFHQPQSTLLLLVSAFIGDDWKQLYQHALDANYRFLSYGDSCLLIPSRAK